MLRREISRFLAGAGPSSPARPNPPPRYETGHGPLDVLIRSSRPEVFAAWLADLLRKRGEGGAALAYALGGPYGRYEAGDPDNNVTADRWLEAAGAAGWVGVGGPSRPDLSQRAFHGLEYGGKSPPPRPTYFFWEPGPAAAEALRFVRAMGSTAGLPPPPPPPRLRRMGFPYDPCPLLAPPPLRFGVIDRRTGEFAPGVAAADPREAARVAARMNRRAAREGVEGAEGPDED